MIKVLVGSVAAAVAMMVVALIFFASPLSHIAYHHLDDAPGAAVQLSLAQSLPGTGTYTIPNPNSQAGAVAFAKGPIAEIHYNTAGYSPTGASSFVPGFVHMLLVGLLLGAALSGFAEVVTSLTARVRTVACFALASSGYIHLADPIWMHTDWALAIYSFVADAVALTVGGFVIARWFLPNAPGVAQR